MQLRSIHLLSSATIMVSVACGRTEGTDTLARPKQPNSVAAAPAALGNARAMVERRYAQHFAGGQGFSLDTLRARKTWFTPRLYELMFADMGHPEEGIGFIEADPFVDGQEDAKKYVVRDARQSHDTVLVDVEVTYPPDVGSGHETRRVTVAALPAAAEWQIADLQYARGSLATGLLKSTAP
jgi:hypothetical protein